MRSAVLCYNLKGTEKGKKIGMIFGFLGYKVRHVETEEYGLPIGALAGIREKGYAVDNCEHERGVYCVAAPVFAPDGTALCAISISGSELYLRDQTIPYAALLRKAAGEISAKL